MEENYEVSSYYGVLPAIVRYDQSLTTRAKILFIELTAVCNGNGELKKSNKYFSERYGLSNTTIAKAVKELKEANLICISKDDDSKRIIKIVGYPSTVFGGGRNE